MRKNVFGRKFKRDKNERQALFKGLLSALVINGRIKTTLQKAKAIKADADKLITKSRKDAILAKRLLERDLIPAAVEKLLKEVAPRFKNRKGGYTRIVRLGNRLSDNAATVILEWVEMEEVVAVAPVKKSKKVTSTKKVVKTKPKKVSRSTSSGRVRKVKNEKPKK